VKTFRVSVVLLAAVASLFAYSKNKQKEVPKVIDKGTFQILVDGKEVGTESFTIEQRGSDNVTSSQIKVSGPTKAEQSSTLEMTSDGQLVHYGWKELAPERAETSIDVVQGSVIQRTTFAEQKKPLDIPYMVSPSTTVLDDNFFSHRQLLVWRFLGSCTVEGAQRKCQAAKFRVLIPAQHITAVADLEMVGPEKQTIQGVEKDVVHIKLMAGDLEWAIYADPADSFKIVRISIPANKTEVLRQ
jgi:hypothetical protein